MDGFRGTRLFLLHEPEHEEREHDHVDRDEQNHGEIPGTSTTASGDGRGAFFAVKLSPVVLRLELHL